MISEGSRDAEDRSNDAEFTALIRDKLNKKTYYNRNIILNCNNISQYYWFYNIFDQITADLKSRRAFFQKH